MRFQDEEQIPPDVPVRIIWGGKDRIARARTSCHADQLRKHVIIETWPDCGHMLVNSAAR